MSLVGALAWLILTMPAICIYVAYLQRHTKEPTVGHVRQANRLLLWIRKNLKRLGLRYRPLRGPLRLITLSDSAFKAMDTQGLVMRGCVILLAEAGNGDGSAHASPAACLYIEVGQRPLLGGRGGGHQLSLCNAVLCEVKG